MAPQSKRRRISLLTLPLVVVCGFLIVTRLAAWKRSELIADLADRISHGDTRDAIEAVHKLATIPNPPVSELVNAAAADEHETAATAQVEIDRLLRCWQRDVETDKCDGSIARHLSELATSLTEKQTKFSYEDRAWLQSAVREILRTANLCPPAKTPLVAVHCDAILTAIGPGPFPARPAELPSVHKFDAAIAAMPDDKAFTQSRIASPSDADIEARQNANEKARSVETPITPIDSPAATDNVSNSNDNTAENPPDNVSMNELRNRSSESDKETALDHQPSRSALPLRSPAAPSVFRVLPAMPINVLPHLGETSKRLTPDSRSAADARGNVANDPIASADSRELLKTWITAANGEIQPIERELARRGFGKLSKPLVQQYFSDDPQDRIRLVDKVLIQPGAGSEAWLLLLAGDADPDVRLFAVTFMATSNNATLVEKAWQAAIRDHDPRVADLAGRLRERREGTSRR